MKILAVDQARDGAWSVFNYEEKTLLDYGTFKYSSSHYPDVLRGVENTVQTLAIEHGVDAVFIEDVSLQKSALAFKRLAWLQGVLINMLEKNECLYDVVAPSQWQNFCNARGRTTKEKKANTVTVEGKKKSKALSIQFVKDTFGIDTMNDNLADAICIGHYVVNNINLRKVDAQ